jgi:tetratricopeptide (TPR) repeat protein
VFRVVLVVGGVLSGLLMLEISLRLAGSLYLYAQERRYALPAEDGTCTILCLGESTTAMGGTGSYPSQLERILNERLPGVRFRVINKGWPGAMTAEIVRNLDGYLEEYSPEIVVAMMGINDTWLDEAYRRVRTEADAGILRFRSLRIYRLWDYFRAAAVRAASFWKPEIRDDLDEGLADGSLRETAPPHSPRPPPLPATDAQRVTQLVSAATARLREGDSTTAERLLKKALVLNPDNGEALLRLAKLSIEDGKWRQAEEMTDRISRQVLASNGYPFFYVELVHLYEEKGRPHDAERLRKRAEEIWPEGKNHYMVRGSNLTAQARWLEAEEMFAKALELGADDDHAYFHIGQMYCRWGNWSGAERAFRRVLQVLPADRVGARLLGALATSLMAQGKWEEAREFYARADSILERGFHPRTVENYRQMRRILNEKGIPLVFVQYPVRGVASLKKAVASYEGVVFVDNEATFKEALRRHKVQDLFEDLFAGSFGHCTPLGNRLLAENVAGTIIDFFRKDRSGAG